MPAQVVSQELKANAVGVVVYPFPREYALAENSYIGASGTLLQHCGGRLVSWSDSIHEPESYLRAA